MSNPTKKVYLITTRDIDSNLIKSFDKSDAINLFDNEDFQSLILDRGSLLYKMYKNNKFLEGSNIFKIFNPQKFWGQLQSILKDFRERNSSAKELFAPKIAKKEITYTEISKEIVDCFPLKENKKKEDLLKLFASIRKITIQKEEKEVDVYVTHNWYSKGYINFDFEDDLLKFKFLDILINIIKSKYSENGIELHLALHDRDLFEENVDDTLLDKEYYLKKSKKEDKNLNNYEFYKLIKERKVYIFQHTDNFDFYKEIISKNLTDIETLDSFFKLKIPPKLEIKKKDGLDYLEIDIDGIEEDKLKNKHSNLREIIYAIAKYYKKGGANSFDLRNIEENKAYSKILNKLRSFSEKEHKLPIVIKSKKPLSLTKEEREKLNTQKAKGEKDVISLEDLDKRAKFLDSSIWLQIVTENDPPVFPKHKNIYETSNAKEVRDFNARLCLDSYVSNFAKGHGGHVVPFPFHSEAYMRDRNYALTQTNETVELGIYYKLLKFDFAGSVYNGNKNLLSRDHTFNEALDRSNLDKAKNVIDYSICRTDLKIRILLLDDNASITMADEDYGSKSKISKYDILQSVLGKDFNLIPYDSLFWTYKSKKSHIILDIATTTAQAKDMMSKKYYDIILLDYLLGYEDNDGKRIPEGNRLPVNKRAYGTDLLKNIEDDVKKTKSKEFTQHIGPLDKYWIFFISSFSTAIREDLNSRGMQYNTHYWHISRGACPTTTPELFKYNLYSLFLRLKEELGGFALSRKEISRFNKKLMKLIDYLDYIFDEKEFATIRQRAIESFDLLLHLKKHYQVLVDDYLGISKDFSEDLIEEREKERVKHFELLKNKENSKKAEANKGSLIVQSMFPMTLYYDNAFWEHLQHMIYKVAYGNILQWNEIYEEYMFIREYFAKFKKEKEKEIKEDKKDKKDYKEFFSQITKVCKNIEEYIYKLKSNS